MDLQRAGRLEDEIFALTLCSPGPTDDKIPLAKLTSNVEFLLRQWLDSLDVPAIRRDGMSASGLVNSYAAGRTWVRNNLINEISQKKGRARRSAGGMDLTGFASEESRGKSVAELLGKPQEEAKPFDIDDDDLILGKPEEQSKDQTQDQSPSDISQAAVDKIVDRMALGIQRLVEPKILAIKRDLVEYNELQGQQLGRQIDGKVRDAVREAAKEFALSEKTKNEIAQIALDSSLKAIRENLPHRLEIKLPNGKVHDLPSEPRHKAFETILKRLLRGQHVYMVGDAGTGKTHMFKQLARAMDQDVTVLPPSLTKYEFSGHMGPTGEYVGTLLRKAVEEGHLLCFDEFDANSGQAILFLNTLTANRYIAFPDKMVEAHENFRVIAAANTYGHGASRKYINRNPMDEASLDRFAYVVVDYDHNLELQIFGTHPWVEYVHRIRKALDELGLTHVVSMRAIERGMSDLLNGDDPDEVCFAQLWRGLDQDTIQKIQSIAGKFGQLREVA